MLVLFGSVGYIPLVFLGTVLIAWVIRYHWNRRELYKFSWKANGPIAWPFFGSMLSFWGDPEYITNYLKKVHNSYESPIVHWFGQSPVVYVKEPEEAAIMLNHQNCILKASDYKPFSWAFGESQWTTFNVDVWRMKRRATAPLFNNKMIEIYASIFEKRSQILVKKMSKYLGKGEFDIFEEFSEHGLNQIMEASMGHEIVEKKPEEVKKHLANVRRGRDFISQRLWRPLYRIDQILYLTKFYREGEKLFEEIRNFIMTILTEKKLERLQKPKTAKPTEDEEFPVKRKCFLDHLLDLNDEGINDFSDKDVQEELLLFTLAASDTSAYTNSRIATLLGMHPEMQEKVYEEIISVVGNGPITKSDVEQMPYMERFIKETMRLFPVGNLLGRHCTGDVNLGTRVIPKGADLGINMHEYMRDPRRWPDPLKFDPDRFLPEEVEKRHPYTYLPYSAGIRICVGYKFGALSLLLTTANLVRTYKFKTKYKKITDLRIGMDMVTKSPNGHVVEIELRNPKEKLT